ncbi:MAG TPA: tetratricopeptide repeat protein, partial [Cyanophyceae cyanobacterium]
MDSPHATLLWFVKKSVNKCSPNISAPPSASMTVTDIASHRVSSWNRQTYQRLKLALSLGLRRQIFLVVCDDLSLRNRLAGKLHAELGAPSAKMPRHSQSEPKLVSLNLNLSDPNPLGQIIQWLAKNRQSRSSTPVPGFQILGAELLTRQPPATQRLFLRRLQAIERNLLRLESTLLLWLPRPWFHTIQQSAPEFWQLHTGIFEFEGEPTPLPPVGSSRPETSRAFSMPEATEGSFKDDLQTLLAHELEETVEPPPLREIIWEKPQQQDNSEHDLTTKETPFEKSGNTSNGHVIPYPFLNLLGTTNHPKLTTPPLSPKEDANSTESPLPPLFGNGIANSSKAPPLKIDPDLKLDDESQELDSYSIDEFQIPALKTDSLTEALKDDSSTLQSSDITETTQQEQLSESPAETYLKLGYYYRQIIEQGDASEDNLLIATQAYELALQFLDDTSPQLSDVRNDLGNLYWMLSRCPGSTDEHRLSYLEQSIQAYQLALTKLVAEETPQTYSMIQNNLGAAYGDLARYKDSAENLEQSIRAYEEALRYRQADSEPMKYAST